MMKRHFFAVVIVGFVFASSPFRSIGAPLPREIRPVARSGGSHRGWWSCTGQPARLGCHC